MNSTVQYIIFSPPSWCGKELWHASTTTQQVWPWPLGCKGFGLGYLGCCECFWMTCMPGTPCHDDVPHRWFQNVAWWTAALDWRIPTFLESWYSEGWKWFESLKLADIGYVLCWVFEKTYGNFWGSTGRCSSELCRFPELRSVRGALQVSRLMIFRKVDHNLWLHFLSYGNSKLLTCLFVFLSDVPIFRMMS